MVDDALTPYIEEYKATQQIMNTRFKVEHNIHYVSFALLGVGLAMIGSQDQLASERLWILLVFPVPFYVLSLILLRNDLVIAANAQYAHTQLRPRVSEMLGGDQGVWQRETAIHKTRAKGFDTVLGAMRYATSLSSLPIFAVIYWLLREDGPGFREWSLLAANLAVCIVIVATICVQVPKAANRVVCGDACVLNR